MQYLFEVGFMKRGDGGARSTMGQGDTTVGSELNCQAASGAALMVGLTIDGWPHVAHA